MATVIILVLCATAEGFLLYVLFRFGQEGARRKRIRPVATITVIEREHGAHLANRKAA